MSTKPNKETCRIVDQRDGYECLVCGGTKTDGWSGYSRHHRLMRSHPFPRLHAPENLIRVCGSGTTGCHGMIHSHPGKAYRFGWLVRQWLDPFQTPILTYRHGWVYLQADGTMHHVPPAELDRWLLMTGLRWKKNDLKPQIGKECVVTLGIGFKDTGTLTDVDEEQDGVVRVTLDEDASWRLEDNATIKFDKQGKETR